MSLSTFSTTAKPSEPMLEHEIRLRAYDLYERRGGTDGHALEDWLQAEHDVLREKGAFVAAPTKRAPYR